MTGNNDKGISLVNTNMACNASRLESYSGSPIWGLMLTLENLIGGKHYMVITEICVRYVFS